MLVGTDDGGVDRNDPVEVAFGVGLGEQSGADLLPRTVGGPRTTSRRIVTSVPPAWPGPIAETSLRAHGLEGHEGPQSRLASSLQEAEAAEDRTQT